MISIPIPQDIREYEPKFLGPLSFREAMCSLCAALIEYAGIRFQTDVLHLPVSSYIPPLVIALIPLFFGFGEKAFHMKPEIYLKMVLANMLTVPKHRPYKTKNYYDMHLTAPKEPQVSKKHSRKNQQNLEADLIAYD